jgi:hypothetical protein
MCDNQQANKEPMPEEMGHNWETTHIGVFPALVPVSNGDQARNDRYDQKLLNADTVLKVMAS